MTDNIRILGAPGRYIQGPGAITKLGEIAEEFGEKAFVVADAIVTELIGSTVKQVFLTASVKMSFGAFGGECTLDEIDRMTADAKHTGCRVIVGIGGGKAIDTAKGVSRKLDLPLIIVPTIASNDAPTSRLIVIYDENHAIAEVLKLRRNPDVVLVDTAVIAKAPVRFLIAGIGDALSKKFEAEQCSLTGARNFFGGLPTDTALILCDQCYRTIRAHGLDAVNAVSENRSDRHVEHVVEAAVMQSGIGFESVGLALAHALTRGLTALSETQDALHGEMVAWGLLVQLIAEGRPVEFLEDMIGFYNQIGLPRALSELGLMHPSADAVSLIAERTCRDAPYVGNMAEPPAPERLSQCIWALEKMSAEKG